MSKTEEYSRFYAILKKVIDGYQRGLSQAIEKNLHYEHEIQELKKELLKSKEIIKYLKEIGAGAEKTKSSKQDIDRSLQEILEIELGANNQSKLRKLYIKTQHSAPKSIKRLKD